MTEFEADRCAQPLVSISKARTDINHCYLFTDVQLKLLEFTKPGG